MNHLEDNPKSGLSRNCLLVLQALENNKSLVSAQEIYMWLKQHEARAPGLTTIYRALELLINQKMVQAVELGDGERRYEEVQPGEHHHHLICQICRANIHLEQCFIDDLESAIQERHGFEIKSHVLEIFGICRECGKKEN